MFLRSLVQCSYFHDIFLAAIPYQPIRLRSRKLRTISVGSITFLGSRHPVPPKRSPLSLLLLIWRYYQVSRTFSTASTGELSRGLLRVGWSDLFALRFFFSI